MNVPTVKIHKDGAEAVVNLSDVGAWIADGWRDESVATPDAELPSEPKRRGRPPKVQS